MTIVKPLIRNAPGLVWKPRAASWEARWCARTDLVKRGFVPKSQRLWCGMVPTPLQEAYIVDTCNQLQNEMLIWGRGGLPGTQATLNGTLGDLIRAYMTDKDSTYHAKRYHSKQRQNNTLARVDKKHGAEELKNINARVLLGWHKEWSHNLTKVAIGHSFIAQLRVLMTFGKTIFEDAECKRLKEILSDMRFPSPRPREERLTADQAVAIRKQAHEHARPSIALAQAFQFDLMLRQKDVIGEWVPMSEPGMSDTFRDNFKWMRGLRWDEIDGNLILRHTTSKKGKPLVVDLKMAPMVMEELSYMAAVHPGPRQGAVIRCETHGKPWSPNEFRRIWRLIANAAGIPKGIRNQDSRAGGISEATDAGADLEMVRHAATHSNISMTQRYSRGAEEKIATVMQLRSDHRNKKPAKAE